jgi:hypothetical protein
MPWETGQFLEAYAGNRTSAINLVLDADVVAVAVMDLMSGTAEWNRTATHLLETLKGVVSEEVLKLRGWPKAPHILTRRLKRIATFLRESGIETDPEGREGRSRQIAFRKSGIFSVRSVLAYGEDQQTLTE